MDTSNLLNLDPRILALLDLQDEKPGIYIDKLVKGDCLIINTRNSVYKFTKTSDDKFLITGGSRWPEPTEIYICGSTFGGSMIKNDYIGYQMHIELQRIGEPDKVVTTSSVQKAKIIGSDYEYEMEW